MNIYEDYYTRYRAAIAASVAAGNKVDLVIKEHFWITVAFLEDRQILPWEKEKMRKLFKELEETNNQKMIEIIVKALEEM